MCRVELQMSEDEFLEASPREIDLYAQQLCAIERREQWHTAQILAMLANCHFNPEQSGKPDGWSPMDYMPGAHQDATGMSMRQWVLSQEEGSLKGPVTDDERRSLDIFQSQFGKVFKHKYKAGDVILEKISG